MMYVGNHKWERLDLEARDREDEDRMNERNCAKHDALVNIAYDCASLEDAQKIARDAIKK